MLRCCLLITMFILASSLTADETAVPVSSPPVLDGLEARWDARQIRPTAAAEDPSAGVPLERWPDTSHHQRDAHQGDLKSQPRLVAVGSSPVVRFDGTDDHLRITQFDRSLDSATIYLVVAPRENPGGFRGILAANQAGGRDFETGLTIDMGPFPTTRFSQLNVEGHGFTGARSLANQAFALGELRVIEVTIDGEAKEVRLTIDGEPQGARPFASSPLCMDELTIGARYYNLGVGPQRVTGFVAADMAEILIYGRALSASEAQRVREYLTSRHAELARELPPLDAVTEGVALESVVDPPAVQMFVPGFEVRELPLALPNINNVRYRPDGTLLAVAYDGDVYLLRDTDGDTLEDRAELFWDNNGRVRSPIGMALTPPGYRRGDGLFVATKSECLLVADTDGDRRADRVEVVATGWDESFHNVDALGVAVDPRDESVYFGLGTANFADPLVKDAEGRATYRVAGERGAVIRVSPDFARREVYCSGIRFPVALAFNRHGDLFCTDQEGATWVPNGNPFDELLHLEPGRHYGFPPRHPQWLPDVIDEPSVYDYAPQHQSTCGLTFNDPTGGGTAFGPGFWEGDALVCGYSRGKLYRTKLVRTANGYVADNRLLACLNMLTVDSCVTPHGGLVVAVHSGGPDWGSGPSGQGKLYQIRYADRGAPQPVAAWNAGPNEVRIAFDAPLEFPSPLRNFPSSLRGKEQGRGAEEAPGAGLDVLTRITYGQQVRAGDEFESLRPGYEVVARQLVAPRYEMRVHSVQVTPDRRTIVLVTDTHRAPLHYALRLPALGRSAAAPSAVASPPADPPPLAQHARIDLDYSLHGVLAEWEVERAVESDAAVGANRRTEERGTVWLPHMDLAVSESLLQGSAPHAECFERFKSSCRLRLRTQVDVSQMLRPAVQPGSELDYELPPEVVALRFVASEPFTVRTPGKVLRAEKAADGFVASLTQTVDEDEPRLALELEFVSRHGDPQLSIAWNTAEDERWRALPLRRFFLPWAETDASAARPEDVRREIPELAGGNRTEGERLFFGEAAACSKCHLLQGKGGNIGPDLSNLVHRDYASVLRDVTQPSFAINPDYITHVVELVDGRTLSGTLRQAGDRLLIGDSQGNLTEIPLADVERSTPTPQSIMPDDLTRRLSPEQLRDLLTFLLVPAGE